MLRARYLDPTARKFAHSVVGWLLDELPGATALRIASGYVSADVLDWTEKPIQDLRDAGGTTSAIFGSNGGATTAADVQRLFSVFGNSLYIEYAEGGIFHPKVYVIEHSDHVSALVGSANFTPSGSMVNVEASLVLSTDAVGPPPEAPLDEIVASTDPGRYPNATQVVDEAVIAELKQLGVIDRIQRSAPSVSNNATATRQRMRRQQRGIARRTTVSDVPAPTSRRVVSSPVPVPATSVAPGSVVYCGVAFSSNDLKDVGTREFSVSSGIREWAGSVIGHPVALGEGTLFEMEIDARLAASPANVVRTPEPVRIWSAGASGETHQDVRLVLGTRLKAALDDEAVLITGVSMPADSIGVFELPPNPSSQPVKLTIFLPDDPEYPAVQARLGRSGREQKMHFRTDQRPAELPPWTT